MLVNEYIRCDVHELANLIKTKQISATDALECALARTKEVNSELNAIVTDCSEFAFECLAGMRGDEPYFGVPLLVKDLSFALAGVRTTEGSRLFSNNISLTNSDIIHQLISLGFVPFAKTNTPELGLSYVTESVLLGPCRNPHDLTRTAGGSSGGSAAAIAAGIAPIATASDGGGSIRIPAACCGLFGFKPTTGLMPSGPYVDEQWSGMATSFILARSVRDTTRLFGQLMKRDLGQLRRSNKKKLHFANLNGAFQAVPVDTPYLKALEQVENFLITSGHTVAKKQLDLDLEAIDQCTLTLIAANTCAVIKEQQRALGRKAQYDELEPITWEFYHRGKIIPAHELINTKNHLYQLMRPLHELLRTTDVILTPALAQLPLSIGTLRTDDEFNSYLQKNIEFSPFTSLFNQAGLPAMTLPIMWHGKLPISIQMGAGKGKDLLLLNIANELQSQYPI